jgi:putative ATPase
MYHVEHDTNNRPVPLDIRNGVTKLMREQGYGRDYKYAHDFGGFADMEFMPEGLKGTRFYTPNTSNPTEERIAERIKQLWKGKY